MPTGKIEVRHIFSHVLTLIAVIAFLHQRRRDRSGSGQLLATVEDYAVARRLVLGPLHAAIGLGSDYGKFAPFLGKLPKEEFDSRQATAAMDAKRRNVTQTWLQKLAEMGVVRCVAEASGNRPARWRRTGKSIDELRLPSVETVRSACVTA
jgi:hypothetical protein